MGKSNVESYKVNYNIIAIVQFILSLVVVAIHVEPINITNGVILRLWDSFRTLAVPFFFLISSYFFSRKYFFNNEKENNILIKNKITKYLKLYLIWNAIYLPITLYGIIHNEHDYGIEKTIYMCIYRLFIEGHQFYSWPLWYLMSLTYSFIILWIVKRLFRKDKFIYIIALIDFIILFAIHILIENKFFGVLSNGLSKIIIDGYTDRPLIGYIYIVLGMIVFKNNKFIFEKFRTRYAFLLLIISFILYCLFKYNPLNYILVVICSVNLFIFVIKIAYNYSNIELKILNKLPLKKLSTVIYFTHMIYFFIWGIITDAIDSNGNIFCYILIISCCIFTHILFEKLKIKKFKKT